MNHLQARDLDERVQKCRRLWGRPEDALMPELLKRIGVLRAREEAVADALIAVLMGGTKVGKTTLINALAGITIGEASARACFTARPAVFVHSSREAQLRTRLAGVLRPVDRIVCHDQAALERIILVDAPDLDGIEVAHHAVFDELLARADLAICVVTTQKYDSAALYEILGNKMGFRRTVVVFNRIDEGIPLSDAVKNDLYDKIAPFNLKPPDGNILPIFGVSAANALAAKLGKPAGLPDDFPAFEVLLRERLTQAVVQRISEENIAALGFETQLYTDEACRLEVVRALAPQLLQRALTAADKACDGISQAVEEAWRGASSGIDGRRKTALAGAVGGPFGLYLRTLLAVRAMTNGLSFTFPSIELMAGSLTHGARTSLEASSETLSAALAEELDRAGLDPTPMHHRFEQGKSRLPIDEAVVAEALRQQTSPVKVGWIEGLALNVVPFSLLLFPVQYFVMCLLETREPGAGIFIGCALLLWVTCYLQTVFWPWRKHGTTSAPPEIKDSMNLAARTRLVEPVREWCAELELLTDGKTRENTPAAALPSR
ncbi:MAG: GTPase domain-containing protein [Candidatus Ozemobacteraceae bacterium]